ncbi:phosphotransferase [Yinghuangia soli]|uniref:Phosphotransferase n=1 Tax=Yinghuangia soli TaxID=2908204 RepID=A0AA41PTW9_9ACTN|nr:phosphotransferase [Yinghuangia soli]MCF2525799.1 phosphotransferase [Yinghuangia soli]
MTGGRRGGRGGERRVAEGWSGEPRDDEPGPWVDEPRDDEPGDEEPGHEEPGHEESLDGGRTGGAVRVGDTVRRTAGPWTSSVHALLAHLAAAGFAAAPRPLGFDALGREVLSFLPGRTVGMERPWPTWVYADTSLDQVGLWMRRFHEAAADFVPPADAIWRDGGRWTPGLVIGHNDAAPYNAAWQDGRLTGFFDWDFAGPVTREWDLAFTAFAWVPLSARHRAAADGFTRIAARPRRLRRLLEAYGLDRTEAEFLDVVRARLDAHVEGLTARASAGEAAFADLVGEGVADDLRRARRELDDFAGYGPPD